MQSLDDLKRELTEWIDGRIDEAIDRGNADLLKDLDTRFQGVEFTLNNVEGVTNSMAKDLGNVVDSVSKLIESVVAIPQSIVDQLGKFNPFHLP